MIIEVIGVGFSLFALSRVILRYREGKFSKAMLALWMLAWSTVIAFIVSPQSFESISKIMGIQRSLDFMLIGSALISYYLTFRIYIYIEEIRQDMGKIAREIALKED